jgi:hypothetical protein
MLCLLGTGLRFGELAGLRRRRVHPDRALPMLQVVDTRYHAGRFGSGFKPRPKSDAGIREVPLARWWWRPSAGSCHPVATRRPWSSLAPAAAQAATAGPGCQRALAPSCRATTSTEVSPDHLGDGADRHTLVRDRVQRRSRRCLLQSQAEQVCRIEPVHGGPTAGAVADEARDSLVTRNTDQGREESVIPVAVTRRTRSHNRRTDAERSEPEMPRG